MPDRPQRLQAERPVSHAPRSTARRTRHPLRRRHHRHAPRQRWYPTPAPTTTVSRLGPRRLHRHAATPPSPPSTSTPPSPATRPRVTKYATGCKPGGARRALDNHQRRCASQPHRTASRRTSSSSSPRTRGRRRLGARSRTQLCVSRPGCPPHSFAAETSLSLARWPRGRGAVWAHATRAPRGVVFAPVILLQHHDSRIARCPRAPPIRESGCTWSSTPW